jgi:hypothetical protein
MRRALVALLMLWLGTAGQAFADPITLTSGGFTFYGADTSDQGSASFSLSGDGFTAQGQGRESVQGGFASGVLDLSGSYGMFDPFGTVTVGDQTLVGFETVSLLLTATPIVISDVPVGAYGGGSAAFTATGLLSLYKPGGGGPALFSQEFNGAGHISITGRSFEPGAYRTQFVGIGFERPASPSPTPEPASLLLLGTGLAAAWRSRRLRGLVGIE